MANKKYKLLTDRSIKAEGKRLYLIEALKDFGNVKEGDEGGFIESEKNLSQDGNCWVSEDAMVFGKAEVYDDAVISGAAMVYGEAKVFEDAQVKNTAKIYGSAEVSGELATP